MTPPARRDQLVRDPVGEGVDIELCCLGEAEALHVRQHGSHWLHFEVDVVRALASRPSVPLTAKTTAES